MGRAFTFFGILYMEDDSYWTNAYRKRMVI